MFLFIFILLVFETEGRYFKSLDSSETKPSLLQVKSAPMCENTTFCEDTLHYPTEIVISVLQKNPSLRNYENTDEIDKLMREDDIFEEEPLCVSMEKIIFPKSAQTRNSGWKYVVNYEDFKQSVRVEICLEEGKHCRVIEGFAEGYYTKCKQKYIYRRLLAISMNGSIYHESFRFPASCCCHVEFRVDEFLKSIKPEA